MQASAQRKKLVEVSPPEDSAERHNAAASPGVGRQDNLTGLEIAPRRLDRAPAPAHDDRLHGQLSPQVKRRLAMPYRMKHEAAVLQAIRVPRMAGPGPLPTLEETSKLGTVEKRIPGTLVISCAV